MRIREQSHAVTAMQADNGELGRAGLTGEALERNRELDRQSGLQFLGAIVVRETVSVNLATTDEGRVLVAQGLIDKAQLVQELGITLEESVETMVTTVVDQKADIMEEILNQLSRLDMAQQHDTRQRIPSGPDEAVELFTDTLKRVLEDNDHNKLVEHVDATLATETAETPVSSQQLTKSLGRNAVVNWFRQIKNGLKVA